MVLFALLGLVLVGCWASFPGAKVHRPARNKLGRGQHTQVNPATVTMTDATSVATMTFNVPVVITGTPNLNVSGGLTFVSQVQTSPTVLAITYSGALTTKTWSLAANDPAIHTYQGGGVAAASGTFS
jgi:hypothetical protein